jgi:3-hydroxyacyl-CoA dehydrogenase
LFPKYAEQLVEQNKLGRKTGEGLYRLVVLDGKKSLEVYDILSGKYRAKNSYAFDFISKMNNFLQAGDYTKAFNILLNDKSLEADICLQFLIRYVIYSLMTTETIGENIHSADHVMATGFNWIPPLALIDAFGGRDTFKHLINKRMPIDYIKSINIDDLFNNVKPSDYDYRPFFKAK